MSFLVQDTDIYLFEQLNLSQTDKSSFFAQISGKNQDNALSSEPLPKYFNNPNCTLFQTTSFNKIIIYRYYTANFFKNLQAIASINLNLETLTVKIQLKLLNPQQNYIGIVINEKKKVFFKSLSKQLSNRDFNLKIGTVRGEITICSPYFYFAHELVKQKLGKAVQKQLRFIKNSLRSNFELLDSFFQIYQEKGFQNKISSINKPDIRSFIKNYHYQKIMNLELCFASETKVKEQDLNNRLQKQKQSIKKIKNHFVSMQSEIHPLFLYTYSLLDQYMRNQLFDCDSKITDDQRNNIKQKIELPSIPKEKCTEQNFYVLNYVITNDRCSLSKCRKINTGGFTQIFLTQLIYWYIGSYGIGSALQINTITSRPPLKKYVIVKHQNKELLKKGQRSRVDHQKYILKQIKNGISIFLCKYYIADKNRQLKDDLLSDYIDYPNLSDYYKRYSYTMSLHTKIYFSILIAQSLRYLQEYKIVHLDLKPSNIMTTKRLSIKIIDFGESYHPDLAKHVPGFSMPYSAPQNFGKENGFTFKNDVFSLGVMMFELFYGKKPFFFYSQQLQSKVYNTGNFYDYLFFCPQQSKLAGQTMVLSLIQAIISKCLSANAENRPELEWIVFILRQCLNYIY